MDGYRTLNINLKDNILNIFGAMSNMWGIA